MVNRIGSTRVESWHVSKLTAAFSDMHEGKTKLEMPPFQRGVVWSPTKQAELIRSLKMGFPVGSLLFYRKAKDTAGIEVNLLVDGLQRTTAIRDYTLCPLSFMGLEDVDSVALAQFEEAYALAAANRELYGDFGEAVQAWMLETRTLEASDGFDAFGLVKSLNKSICEPDNPVVIDDALAAAAHAFLKAVADECSIAAIEVPVLFYEGSDSDLPDIFERINATGTKLSKYEIFAASWVNQDIQIANDRVVDAVRKRYYALMTTKNISVNGVKADGTPERFSLFDYLFGLGKVLSDDYPLLFGGNDDPTVMESVAFALATVCHRLPLSQMHRLPQVMDRETGKIAPTQFETALLESAQFVQETLSPYIGLKLNSESATSAGLHTDLQIASMVARVFSGTYVPGTWERREGSDADRSLLKTTMPQHYLVDVLQQNWRGSGDHRLYQMVWDTLESDETEGKILSPGKFYLRAFPSDEFDRTLEQWFGEQVRLSQRSRAYVTAPARAFLKYIYSDVVTVNAENKETFELDHVFPVSRLVGPAKNDGDGWPISAVANLALFDWQTNREKSRLDLPQYLEKVEPAERPRKRAAVEKYLFLRAETAEIPRDAEGNDILTRDQYIQFLRERFEKMKGLAFDTLGIARPVPDILVHFDSDISKVQSS